MIYLDYNASAPLLPVAREAVIDALALPGNAASGHRFGREARLAVETAREAVARLAGVAPEAVAFTSGATEANNWALRGSGRSRRLASAIEHPSVLAVPGVETFPVRPDGTADLEALDRMLGPDGSDAIVSLMAANNETGVIQPVEEVVALAHARGALVHCDAVQAAGRVALSGGVDLLSLSAHKLGGPKGVGALIMRGEAAPAPFLVGGGQERRRRAGTENVPAITGFGAAAEAAIAFANIGRVAKLRDRLEASLPAAIALGAQGPRLANTSCLVMPGVAAETQLMAFDLDGIAVSAGSACSSGKVAISHVLEAMGVPPAHAACAIRISLGPGTTEAEIDAFIAAWRRVHARVGSRAA